MVASMGDAQTGKTKDRLIKSGKESIVLREEKKGLLVVDILEEDL